jgi:hypothetical protein
MFIVKHYIQCCYSAFIHCLARFIYLMIPDLDQVLNPESVLVSVIPSHFSLVTCTCFRHVWVVHFFNTNCYYASV